jgi:hypothetical protein
MEKENQIKAVMNIEKGEEIIGAWITPKIPEIGFYKLLAKQKKDGSCEWVHFIQRDNGEKDSFFRGEVKSKEKIENVVTAINNSLSKIFGNECKLRSGNPDVYTLDGRNLDTGSVN